MAKPRTIRELESLPREEAVRFWESLTTLEQVKFANAMTAEDINLISDRDSVRSVSVRTLGQALSELTAAETSDGRFIFIGDGDTFDLTEEYCNKRVKTLEAALDGETEESLGFYGYHNMRLWVEAFKIIIAEHKKRKG